MRKAPAQGTGHAARRTRRDADVAACAGAHLRWTFGLVLTGAGTRQPSGLWSGSRVRRCSPIGQIGQLAGSWNAPTWSAGGAWTLTGLPQSAKVTSTVWPWASTFIPVG